MQIVVTSSPKYYKKLSTLYHAITEVLYSRGLMFINNLRDGWVLLTNNFLSVLLGEKQAQVST